MDYEGRRERMVRTQIEKRGVRDPKVLRAFRKVPRHRFVSEAFLEQAYDDSPWPIGQGQTISQPYTVAVMTELLNPGPDEEILEIGTGSGYQAAILAELAKKIYSIERIPELAESAGKLLEELGYENVDVRVDDGSVGLKGKGRFTAIMVTAGAAEVPDPLLEQLEDGGRMVIPVGGQHTQTMMRIIRKGDKFKRESHGAFRFVELVGKYGWEE
jgi:protein-L-isoaspartate(D-aspartate) O-methyltransferase